MISYFNIVFSTINSLLLLFFFHSISIFIFKKLKLTFSKNFFYIFFIFLIISIISLLLQIILIFDYKFFYEQKNNLRIFVLFIICLNFFYFFINNKLSEIKKLFFFLKRKNWVSIFLLLVFICSLGIVNDADSLIYHSKISKIVLSGFKINYFYDNPHNLLIGTYEVFNILPEILRISNFNTLLNFYVLFFFIKFMYEKFEKHNVNTDLFILLIISIPVIAIILSVQKSFFVSVMIQFLTFFYILYNKKFIKKEYLIIVSALILTTTFKLNFILTVIPIYLCFYLKSNNFEISKYIFKISILFFFTLIIPHLIFKTIFFETPFPPMLNNYLNSYPFNNLYEAFSSEIREWRRNSILFPLNLIINYYNGSLSSIHNSLGIGLLSFLFIKKLHPKNLKLILFCVLSILILNVMLVQQTPRFYFLPYLISLLIIFESKLHKINLLKKIIFLQFIFTLVVISFLSSVSTLTTFFDNQENYFKEKLIFRYAAFKKINQITGGKKFIIVDLPNYYSLNYEISTMVLRYISNDDELNQYKNYINRNDVNYFFSINFPLEKKKYFNIYGKNIDNFFIKCFKNIEQKFSVPDAKRKNLILKSQKQITYYVYKKINGCKF